MNKQLLILVAVIAVVFTTTILATTWALNEFYQ